MEGEGRDGDLFDLKFRLAYGSDLGPRQYTPSTTIASLKEDIIAQWPPDRENGPTTMVQVKLIHAGRILENSNTLAGSRLGSGELPGGVITMHLVIRPPGLARSSEILLLHQEAGTRNILMSEFVNGALIDVDLLPFLVERSQNLSMKQPRCSCSIL